MRPSFVSLAAVAGTLISICLCAADAAACCAAPDANELNKAAADGGRANAEEVLPSSNASPAPTPLELSPAGGVDKTAYADVFRILKGDNPCSRFFGGTRTALTVFNEFALRLRKKSLGTGAVAILMTGGYTNYQDAATGASYRLFEEATVNSKGPFPLRYAPPESPGLKIGRFPVWTRQAKALILLHELGHLIRGKDGKWLLPEDGDSHSRSERNSWAVQSRCRDELLALGG